jgi:hypothetical protein
LSELLGFLRIINQFDIHHLNKHYLFGND